VSAITAKQKALDAKYGIVRKAGRCGGRPTVGESRLDCRAVLAFVIAGGGDTYLAIQAYPHVSIGQIDAVVAWALQTPERWR
jgi:uncharacterized protein (DUF433 family)